MILLLLAAIAAGLLVWLGAEPRRAAFTLAFAVGTNASGVLEVHHGVPALILAFAAVVLGVTALRWLARGWRFEPRVPVLCGLTIVALVVLSAAMGPFVSDTPISSAQAVSGLVKHLVVLAAVVATTRTVGGLRAGLYGLVAAGTTLSLLTVYQVLTGRRDDDLLGFGSWSSELLGVLGAADRATGPFGDDPNSYAMYLAVMLAATLGLIVVARRGAAARPVLGMAAVAMALALVSTVSRTGLVATGAVLLVVAVWLRPNRNQTAIGAAVLTVVLLGPFGVRDRLATLGQVTSATDERQLMDAGLRGRTSEMLAAWRMFVDHPVSGVGFGAYNDHYLAYSRVIGLDGRLEPRSAHSLPLEIAAEQGLIGLAAWGLLAVFATVVVVRLSRSGRPEWFPLGLALIAFGVSSLFLHDVHPRLMWTLIGLTIGAAAVTTTRSVVPPRDDGGALIELPEVSRVAAREPSRLRVAMVIQSYVPAVGGAERQLASLVPLLVARGVEPIVITRSMRGQPRHEVRDGARVVRVPVWGPKPLRSLLFVLQARGELRRFRPHVVHAYDAFTPSSIAIAHARHHGAAVVTKLLRSGELGDLRRLERKPLGRRRLYRLLARVDAFVVISSDIARELDRFCVPLDRQVVIPNGVDTQRFRPRPDRARQLSDVRREAAIVVVATGRLAPEKRLVELAGRWGPVRSTRAPWARLVIVGEGPDRQRLEQFDGVDVLGRREDVDDVLRSSDIYVSASAAEGLSNSLLEAMACGLACVVTDVGGVCDVLSTGRDGLVVDADDLDALLGHVAELARSARRRRRLGRSARARVVEQFGLDLTADRLAALYLRLAEAEVVTPATTGPEPRPPERRPATVRDGHRRAGTRAARPRATQEVRS